MNKNQKHYHLSHLAGRAQFEILSFERGKGIYWYTAACNLLAGEGKVSGNPVCGFE
jgi:hypothetical protein